MADTHLGTGDRQGRVFRTLGDAADMTPAIQMVAPNRTWSAVRAIPGRIKERYRNAWRSSRVAEVPEGCRILQMGRVAGYWWWGWDRSGAGSRWVVAQLASRVIASADGVAGSAL